MNGLHGRVCAAVVGSMMAVGLTGCLQSEGGLELAERALVLLEDQLGSNVIESHGNFAPSIVAIGTVSGVAGQDATFSRWGYWANLVGTENLECENRECYLFETPNLFWAYLHTGDAGVAPGVALHVEGKPSGSTPVVGDAYWAGGVRAIPSQGLAVPVEGKSELKMDLPTALIDVKFSEFSNGASNISWSTLPVHMGVFRASDGSLSGQFYGARHDGVAGKFSKDGLIGIYGAVRAAEPVAPAADTTGSEPGACDPALGSC